jgi:hypothetical protein
MTDLSEDDRGRIQEEERYRREVQQQLQQSDAKRKRTGLIEFFNTNLGLWLLSAVFISGLGTVYKCYEDDRQHTRSVEDKRFEEQQLRLAKKLDEQAAQRVVIDRLDREISYRFSRALVKLREIGLLAYLKESGKTGRALQQASDDHLRRVDEAVNGLLESPADARGTLYQEDASKSIPALIMELASHIDDAHARSSVEEVHRGLLARAEQPIRIVATGGPHAKEAASWIQQSCLLPRWRKQGFAYTTCPPVQPFCESDAPASSQLQVTVR